MVKRTSSSLAADTSSLGEKLRFSRKNAGMTMQAVADGAGLSVGFISQIERDLTVPSLSSLRAITQVLGQPISHFLEQPQGQSLTSRGAERTVYSVPQGKVRYERLSNNFPGSTLRSVLVHEPPGYRHEPISHEGEEMYFLLHGEITVEIEGEQTILRTGDTIHFDSRRVHATWNHGTETATLLWCGTMDVFGEDTIDPTHGSQQKQQDKK
jgi:transcriptional regulator with XRE-family HTH domain